MSLLRVVRILITLNWEENEKLGGLSMMNSDRVDIVGFIQDLGGTNMD